MLDPLLKSPAKLIAALVILALGVTGFGIFLALRPASTTQNNAQNQSQNATPTNSLAPAQPGDGVTALGRLEPGGEVFCVSSPSGGFNSVIRKWMVREGDRVQQNQVLAVMDTYDRLYAAALQAQAQVKEAETRVLQAQTGAKQAEVEAQQSQIEARQAEVGRRMAELQNAEREYKRYDRLYKDGAVSASDLDQRRLTFETANEAVRVAAKEFEQARRTQASLVQVRPVDVQQAQAQLQVALTNLQRAKAELDTAAVRSPIAGQVLTVHVKEGEQAASAGAGNNGSQCNGIAELGKTDQMYAIAEVDESSVARVRRGQKATITSQSGAFSGEIGGTVDYVGLQIRKNDVLNTDPVADTDTRIVEVKIRLDNSSNVSRLTNSKVNVRIVTQ